MNIGLSSFKLKIRKIKKEIHSEDDIMLQVMQILNATKKKVIIIHSLAYNLSEKKLFIYNYYKKYNLFDNIF